MALLGGLDLRLDPWAVDYGAEIGLAGNPEPVPETVDLSVEVPGDRWTPLRPGPDAHVPARLVFVDGVRRVEARVLARDGDRLVHGAFGSFGVGCVLVEDGRARWHGERIERVLALSGGIGLADPVEVVPGASYRPISAAEDDPDAPMRRLQQEMRYAESAAGREAAGAPDTLVVADGPLRFEDAAGAAVGYVKRLLLRHGAPLATLAALPPGTRSPLAVLHSGRDGFTRYAWFVRLSPCGPAELDLAGIVRLEVSDAVGLEAARRLADGSAALLPRFAPSRSRDPRAPQNLLPIGALEARLRRAMGDPLVARRRIQSLLASAEALHA